MPDKCPFCEPDADRVWLKNDIVYALIGAVLALWAFLALATVLHPVGLPALSVGCVTVVAIMMLGAQTSAFVEVVPLEQVGRPEDQLVNKQ